MLHKSAGDHVPVECWHACLASIQTICDTVGWRSCQCLMRTYLHACLLLFKYTLSL